MEARPFRIRGTFRDVAVSLVRLYPLLLLGAIFIRLPLSLAEEAIREDWRSLLGLRLSPANYLAWYVPTPLVVFHHFYAALTALVVWNRAGGVLGRPWPLGVLLPSVAV